MGDVWFYHLTETTAEDALPRLLAPALAKGWNVELRGTSPRRMEWLDQTLWQGAPDAFLPHGLAGGPHDALQPVLLSVAGQELPPRACLMLVDGAPFDPAEAELAARICIVFDATDPEQMGIARSQWKQVTAAGLAAQYWAQDLGRWVKKQERAAG